MSTPYRRGVLLQNFLDLIHDDDEANGVREEIQSLVRTHPGPAEKKSISRSSGSCLLLGRVDATRRRLSRVLRCSAACWKTTA